MSPTQASSEIGRLSEKQRADLALAQSPLERARTLPPWAYTDAGFYAAEEKFVLRREWLSVGRVEEIPQPGDYFTTKILREPLIVVRGKEGGIQTLSAVCRHRAMVVATDRGRTDRFVCPYHSWAYDTSGRLLGAANMKGNAGFNKKDCALPKVRTEIWQGWIFVNFDPDAEPLAPRLKTLDAILDPYQIPNLKTPVSPLVYEQHFNWKLLPDNWEHYHVIGAHARSLLPNPAYTARTEFPWEMQDAYSLSLNPMNLEFTQRQDSDSGDATMSTGREQLAVIQDLPPVQRRGFVAVHVFPCHLILLSPTDMIYYKILPQSGDYFRLEAQFSVLPQVAEDPAFATILAERRKALDFIHGEEDVFVLEGTQYGTRSSLAEQGYLSPDERPLWQFYNYLVPRVLEGLDSSE